MYKNYYFDLYGTLVDVVTNENKDEVWEKMILYYGYYGAVYTPEEMKDIFDKTKKKLLGLSSGPVPTINIEDVFYKLFKNKDIKPKKKYTKSVAKAFRMLTTESIHLIDGTREVLEKLKEDNKNVYIISNDQSLYGLSELKLLGVDKYFDDYYFASDMGISMPDENFMKKVLDESKGKAKESLIISNNLDKVIKSSSKMDSVFLYDTEDINVKNVSKYTIEKNNIRNILKVID
ncbi:putative hydrolase of the HAD superfamily [Natranaerovirga pectinivora]|uniref:Putative hydrolase of the HAD superfamily n=1 Tax=Natranaerovirga pectinivora TaxID=682400 RepID=A0A4R3MKD9_9FIRM|nr:HAD family hydrolase [Natranaerovirga pectinivora]TCT13935.1 putative hydrolase of the HAD superfamily [Natranaerovirga pectinivora]